MIYSIDKQDSQSEMIGLRALWQGNRTVLNSWLSIPCGFSAEIMAHQGWDSLTIDLQHGMIDFQSAVQMLTAISGTSTVPLVRVPWLDPAQIMRVLDAGALGVICPMIDSAADAERFVSYLHYPPTGERSHGPVRAGVIYGENYRVRSADWVVGFAMIETRNALENLDAILSVPHLDGVYVGPSDLALSLGIEPSRDPTNPLMVEAIQHIVDRAHHHGLRAGCHTGTAAQGRKMAQLGYDLITVESDARILAAHAAAAVKAFRE